MPDSLIYFGGEVKALDDKGRIGGYLVRFTDEKHKDLDGDFFTKDTYFGRHDGDGVDLLFHHGRPVKVEGEVPKAIKAQVEEFAEYIFKSPIKTKRDAIGIWAEAVLNMADEYEKEVFGLVKKKKLGWSSGAVSHLVRRADNGEMKRWPIGEGSLTPRPAEPLNRAIAVKSIDEVTFVSLIIPETQEEEEIEEIKTPSRRPLGLLQRESVGSYLAQLIEDRVDDGQTRDRILGRMAREAGCEIKTVDAILQDKDGATLAHLKAFSRVLSVDYSILEGYSRRDYADSIKGIFETTLQEQGFSSWRLWDIFCGVVTKIATVAKNAAAMGMKFDANAKLDEAYAEFVARHKKLAVSQINDYIEANVDERFYLKALSQPLVDIEVTSNIDLDDHISLAVSACKNVIARFRGNHEARTKAGRVLSDKNRKRVQGWKDQLMAMADDCQKLLDDSEPMATDAEKLAAMSKTLRLKWEARKRGVKQNA